MQRVVDVLEQLGVAVPFPYSSALLGSERALRELRIQSKGKPLRIAYAFDPERQAVVLLGADKTGDKRFYEWFIPEAERLWKRYLAEMEAARKKAKGGTKEKKR